MNKEEQRMAIAILVCGWKPNPFEMDMCGQVLPQSPPDYLNDLNAMHEAEALLDRYEAKLFEEKLFNILESEVMHTGGFALIHATAAQRAEALLKALNLWRNA
jgi:hypothetical protein